MTFFPSTGRRRELGADLRHLRQTRGYNGVDMAAKLKWTSTMLSRAETGKRPMTTIEVATYTAMCGVTGEQQEELLALAREPDDYRLKAHPGKLPDELRSLIFLESTATAIDTFEPIFIPGILQTPDYARSLFIEGGKLGASVIEGLVDIRIARRDVLTRYNPAQCVLYVHENALRTPVGGPHVMHEQLLQLIFASGREQCSVRVVPTGSGSRGLAAGSFHIFSYAEDSPMVYVQNETTCEFIENGRDVLAYRAVLDRVASVALTDAQSGQMIEALAGDYERQGATQHEDGAGQPPGLAQE